MAVKFSQDLKDFFLPVFTKQIAALKTKIRPLSTCLDHDVLKSFDRLFPFYECGLKKGVEFR